MGDRHHVGADQDRPLITLVPAGEVDRFWTSLSDGFARATLKTGGDISCADLWQGSRNGTSFLVVAHDETSIWGASIWRPEIWQTGTKLRCLALYGNDMGRWIEAMHDMVKSIARNCGATSIVSEGRAGWVKVFPKAKVLRYLYEEQI